MKLRGNRGQGGGARVRRRRQSAAERLASAFGGQGREVEFGAVDGVYRAAEHDRARGQAMSEGAIDQPPARVRPTVHLYTAGGRTRALFGARVGQHVDLFG